MLFQTRYFHKMWQGCEVHETKGTCKIWVPRQIYNKINKTLQNSYNIGN